MRAAALLLAVIALLLATACQRDNVRPDLPTGPATVPELVIVERKVYVSIRPELTVERPIAEGTIAQCYEVAAARKAELVKGNSQLRRIAATQGTEVEP